MVSVKWIDNTVVSCVYDISTYEDLNVQRFCQGMAQRLYLANKKNLGSRDDFWFWDFTEHEVGNLPNSIYKFGMAKQAFPLFPLPKFIIDMQPIVPREEFGWSKRD